VRYTIDGSILTGIADAIRNKTGSEAGIAPVNMANEIDNIPSDIAGALSTARAILDNQFMARIQGVLSAAEMAQYQNTWELIYAELGLGGD